MVRSLRDVGATAARSRSLRRGSSRGGRSHGNRFGSGPRRINRGDRRGSYAPRHGTAETHHRLPPGYGLYAIDHRVRNRLRRLASSALAQSNRHPPSHCPERKRSTQYAWTACAHAGSDSHGQHARCTADDQGENRPHTRHQRDTRVAQDGHSGGFAIRCRCDRVAWGATGRLCPAGVQPARTRPAHDRSSPSPRFRQPPVSRLNR